MKKAGRESSSSKSGSWKPEKRISPTGLVTNSRSLMVVRCRSSRGRQILATSRSTMAPREAATGLRMVTWSSRLPLLRWGWNRQVRICW